MGTRIKTIILLFILVLIVIIIGNYIHVFLIKGSHINENNHTYAEANNDFAILIEVDKKRLSVIDLKTNDVIKTYAIATGKEDTPTPLGTFKIVEKAKWGGGFGSRWMGLNVPWGKYGIHGTNRPGSIGFNASAGCIRMRNKDVEELFDMVDYNTTVTITNGNYGPFGHGFRNLRPGDRGADVAEVQKRLMIKGYYKGSIDGIYGEGMKYALIEFLKNNNIPLTDTIDSDIYEKLGIILMD
ncbi:MAG: L,D-transpeptidase family protein [Tissierellia bacterium]|nr:L,D-transpeptidase family protein [Tissierellia bacterium]